jgi:hypothetical protein
MKDDTAPGKVVPYALERALLEKYRARGRAS